MFFYISYKCWPPCNLKPVKKSVESDHSFQMLFMFVMKTGLKIKHTKNLYFLRCMFAITIIFRGKWSKWS